MLKAIRRLHLTSRKSLISFRAMRHLIGLLKMVIFLIPMVFLFVIAVFALLAGTLISLLSGRRPRFQIRTTHWRAERSRQPVRDVTPRAEGPERQLS